MKTTTAFNAFQARRAATRRAAAKFATVSMKKDGTPRKVMPADLDRNGFATSEEAEARKIDLEKMNPGRTFTVVTL